MTTDRYADVRRREHSTRADAITRHRRDTDAFTAGAQYALDELLARTGKYSGPINTTAAIILDLIHEGKL